MIRITTKRWHWSRHSVNRPKRVLTQVESGVALVARPTKVNSPNVGTAATLGDRETEEQWLLISRFVTTALELPGYRIVRNYGMVRGIVVRSRSVIGTIGASLQTIVGGNITLFTELCERTREEAFELMLQHAAERGANAVISMRYDANEVMSGVTEVLAYGTAVVVEKAGPGSLTAPLAESRRAIRSWSPAEFQQSPAGR